jgi:hypothetical protein
MTFRLVTSSLIAGVLGCSFPDYQVDEVETYPISVCTDGAPSGAETGLDCGGICPPCAAGQSCVAAGDCESGVCDSSVCQRPTCDDTLRNGDETDTDCGGICSKRCTVDQACQTGHDCESGVCTAGICQAPACDDLTRNGSETGVDCGGPCGACQDGKPCGVDDDCQSNRCSSSICVNAGCSDNMQNGDETDVDCGGSCPPCASTGACHASQDCGSLICDTVTKTCAEASCTDEVQNASESDLDCGGGACPGCVAGLRCSEGADCESGLCKSGVCMPDTATGIPLSRMGWVVDASDTDANASPDDAIDDELSTRWSSGTNQAPGMWFELDMIEPRIFFSIVLENTGDQSGVSSDAPILFDVYLSLDGEGGPAVKQGLVGARETTITFESAQYARQVRFELQGSKEKWWSIHDLRVLE